MYSNQSEEYAIDKDKQFSNEEKDMTGKKKETEHARQSHRTLWNENTKKKKKQ